MQLSLVRYVVAAVVVQLVLVTRVAVEAASATATTTTSEDAKVANGRLRGILNKITGSEQADEKTPPPVKEIVSTWTKSALQAVEKINGDEAIVVFYDKETSPLESAIVTYDVRSQVNCVVSVCGLQSNWYSVRAFERCYDLRIAQRSLDASEHGLIRGISAAYSALRPVATNCT